MRNLILIAMLLGSLITGLIVEEAEMSDIETTTTTSVIEIMPTVETAETIETIETTETVEATEATFVIEETLPPQTVMIEPSEEEKTELLKTYLENAIDWYGDIRVYPNGNKTVEICGEEVDRDFLAKLLCAEAGGQDWWCQIYTCSAILNHCEVSGMTLWDCGHNENHFAVAPFVDEKWPSALNYSVVDYVLNGGRVEDICYFRTDYYHSFGTPVCKVGAHYFSMK